MKQVCNDGQEAPRVLRCQWYLGAPFGRLNFHLCRIGTPWASMGVRLLHFALPSPSLHLLSPVLPLSCLPANCGSSERQKDKPNRKAAREAAKPKRSRDDEDEQYLHRHKRQRTDERTPLDHADDNDVPSKPGSHRSHKPDYDYIQAQVEEERFEDKLWSAMGQDERLNFIEATLNSYAHVPRRWRRGGMERTDAKLDIDPRYMEDEDYAEWIRAGMWR